ncbi:Glutamine-dependent 2-keto-4-methylthiobutyrate transaminase [Paucilactobacillus wasatchensis]|uniref:Glutamine-dependent 2-keto-4-methylthiobutyrate transaminase n=1 Tax=Paucilactobacillus wasatchensis TaxID=1335616 RepID=A0A0D0YWJ1_9LACO|nr:Glutamine-dependent 2-keto-4-methylthiobutyrate transaminase [Paucilactobacillus wasatchensis]
MIFEPAKRVKAIPRNFFNQLDEKISRVEDKATLIDLAKGNPDQPTPDFIVTALKQAVDQPKNHGYTPFDGKKNLLNAIADYYQREHGVQIDPQKEVLTFTGSVIGITALPQTLLNPGDYVITTNPCYPEYYSAVSLAGGKLWQLDINPANHYLPDLTSVPKDVLAKAKILLLNYPNNPTGATATQAFFNQAIEFGKQNGILVVNDFAYAALGFNGQAVSLIQNSGSKEYAVELNTLSKTYNMAGWRV